MSFTFPSRRELQQEVVAWFPRPCYLGSRLSLRRHPPSLRSELASPPGE